MHAWMDGWVDGWADWLVAGASIAGYEGGREKVHIRRDADDKMFRKLDSDSGE